VLGVNNHKVDVERFLANLGYRLNDGESKRDVGYEDTVHNVEVEPVGIAAVDHLDVSLKVQEVCRE
jgi:ABC-type Fe3+-citrate transport system substrate-binding protein